jgi:hypothetical protein
LLKLANGHAIKQGYKECKMTLNEQIEDTCAMAKEMFLVKSKQFREYGQVPVQSKDEAEQIIEQRKWLHANFKKIKINAPGTRTRMGFTQEAVAAMTEHFSKK